MSGEKRTPIQILRDDFNTMRKQVFNLEKQRKKIQEELRKARSENKAQITALQTQLEKRSAEYDRAINSLESDMRAMAKQHHRAIKQQREEFIEAQERQREELMSEVEALENRTDHKIENLRSWTQESMEKQRLEYLSIAEKHRKEINHIKSDISAINQKEQNRQDRASAYIRDLKKMLEVTEKNIPHKKFAPGKMEKIRRQLQAAEIKMSEDIPSAAVSIVQQAHFDLMDLEEEVSVKETEFNIKHLEAQKLAAGLLKTVRQNRQLEIEEGDETQEADFWTNGRFSELENNIALIEKVLNEEKESLISEEVDELLEKLYDYYALQEKLVDEAIERIVSSQVRAEMSDSVIFALQDQGFDVKEGEVGYLEADQRKPYLIKMENSSGTEVVTVISPDEETHRNILSVNTYSRGIHNEEAEQLRNRQILNVLSGEGISFNEQDIACNPRTIEEFYEVKDLIQQRGKKIPESVLKKAGMLNSQTQTRT